MMAASDFWAMLSLDLDVRVEWLAQMLESIPDDAPTARLGGYARALEDVRAALERVGSHRKDPALEPLYALERPLAAYLSCLYAWCDEVAASSERMAVALRQRRPTSVVFHHHTINDSYARFDELARSVRRDVGACSNGAFEAHLEELVWATEWLHMTLASLSD